MTQLEWDQTALDVNNCDREPVHIPGTVQSFGALLASDLRLEQVTFASRNLGDFTGLAAGDALGKSVTDVLGSEPVHQLRNVLSMIGAGTQRERVTTLTLNGRPIDLFVHRSTDKRAVIEAEPVFREPIEATRTPLENIRLLLSRARQERDTERFLRACVRGLYAITGYDRVKAYRFLPDGSGEVVAEALSPGTDSFLHMRYPASDIPVQVRALQIKNPIRILGDVAEEPVPIQALDDGAEPLDLTFAHLRGVSPIHVQYLKNMGVMATLTISLIVDGKLWGMFALHHYAPKVITSDTRIASDIFGQMVSLMLAERLAAERADARAHAAMARQVIVSETDATTDLLHAFPGVAQALGDVIDCNGLAVVREDKVQATGSVPPAATIREIAGYAPWNDDLIAETSHLAEAGWHGAADLGPTAGCLMVRATAAFPLQLMFFRDEVLSQVKWAGAPEKRMEDSPYGPRLSPRGSFELYSQEQRDRSLPWSEFDLAAARELQVMLTQITAKSERVELTRHKDLVSHQRQQDLMIAELNHRVKNILALIRSLSRQAKDSSASLESYALALEQRIAALSAAHDLAVSDSMSGVSLRGILETEVGPYQSPDLSQVILSGPVVGLRADVAPMIALVFHEIVSNAAKYGALSSQDGIVQARWQKNSDGLSFHWREIGGPEVAPPTRHGFGRSLIEKAIPYEFDGTVYLRYDPGGLKFQFTLPPDTLVDLDRDSTQKLVGTVGTIKLAASGKRALLVEDNVVLAMDMVETLTRLGASSIETAGTTDTALRELSAKTFDFAVLDMNLRGVVAFDVAQRLKELRVPFLFVTGYGSKIEIPPDLADVPILTKPIDEGTLSSALADLFDGS